MRNEDVKSHLTWRTLDNKSNYWFSAATDKWLVLSIKYGSVSADIYLFAQKFRTCSLCTLGGWQSQRYSELRLMIWCSRALIRAIRQLFHYWLKNFNFPITQSIIYLSDMYCASCFVTCKKKKIVIITLSFCLHLAPFVQPTVKNPKTLHLLSQVTKKWGASLLSRSWNQQMFDMFAKK